MIRETTRKIQIDSKVILTLPTDSWLLEQITLELI